MRSHYSCQVEPYLDVIAWLDRERIDYDWLVNLTAQDYPVKPVASSKRCSTLRRRRLPPLLGRPLGRQPVVAAQSASSLLAPLLAATRR